MPLIDKSLLLAEITPPFHPELAKGLLDEFISLERRYVLRDWEPAELDGGQFAEILSRILYHQDSGTLNLTKGFDECVTYLQNDKVQHQMVPRHDAIHLSLVLRSIYKIRSQRGAVHISATYSANEMDSKVVIECVRWCLCETLRKFWSGERETAAKAVRELVQFDVPSVGRFGEKILVQRTHLSVDEEVLILLHYAGETGFSRSQIGKYAMHPAPTVTRSLQRLSSARRRMVIQLEDGYYRLTDLGSKHVREQLAEMLILDSTGASVNQN